MYFPPSLWENKYICPYLLSFGGHKYFMAPLIWGAELTSMLIFSIEHVAIMDVIQLPPRL